MSDILSSSFRGSFRFGNRINRGFRVFSFFPKYEGKSDCKCNKKTIAHAQQRKEPKTPYLLACREFFDWSKPWK